MSDLPLGIRDAVALIETLVAGNAADPEQVAEVTDRLRAAGRELTHARATLASQVPMATREQVADPLPESRDALLVEEVEALRAQVAQQNVTLEEHPTFRTLQAQLLGFQTKIHRNHFWTAAFAETFAESLIAMERAHHPLEVATTEEVHQAFHNWHRDMEAALSLFQTDGFNAEIAEDLRRDLICQWVYFRWLELTDDLGRSP